jgi:hypothetical protein
MMISLSCVRNYAVKQRIWLLSLTVLCVTNGPSATSWGANVDDLPQVAQAILTKYCAECHSASSAEGGIDYASDLGKLVSSKKVVPGKPDESRVLKRMLEADEEARMPPPYATHPTLIADEIDVVSRWIAEGAKLPEPKQTQAEPSRERMSNRQVLEAMHRHLSKLDPRDRAFQRYFTLQHLHNLPGDQFSAVQLRMVRGATSKVLNSLSWRAFMVLPRPIDADGTVLAIDLRDLDWDAAKSPDQVDFWQHLLDGYPYGLTFDQVPKDDETQALASEVYQMAGTRLPAIRADWFVANASRPPYYHKLLYDLVLPNVALRAKVDVADPDGGTIKEFAMSAQDLENFLRVDVAGNLRRNRAARSGFAKSNVSSGSRMLERHEALFGAYWKSYDFTRKNIDQDVLRKPLGPVDVFHSKNANRVAFQHDGGEVIFNLPNGLQGYLLVDYRDERLAFAPPSLVSDGSRALGNAQIVNGISCMYCHSAGMIRGFQDEVRFGALALESDDRAVMRRLYLDPSDFDALIEKDEKRFAEAAEKCLTPYLEPGDFAAGIPEPIKAVAQRFVTRDLSLIDIATELDVNAEELKAKIRNNVNLTRKIGLAGVAEGGKIKRASWEKGAGISLFQSAAMELKIGAPETASVP